MAAQILTLETLVSAEELRDRLKAWEPWSIRIDFSNGVSTKDFQRRVPFNEHPLKKFSVVESAIPFAELTSGRMLDIGCNAGYNSIHAAAKYGLSCTGIDVVHKHIEISKFFSKLAGADAQFYVANAETFSLPEEFDVVLHFGTLYHLPNPLLSLRATFDNLRPGGYLALETQLYDHPEDPNVCYFMHMQNNDATNFWALSSSVLRKCLELVGFQDIRDLRKVVPTQGLARHMVRILLVARKPESPTVRPNALQDTNENSSPEIGSFSK